MISNKEHIKALKNYIDDPTATDDLRLDVIQWMWDNRSKISTPGTQDDQFQNELTTFVRLTIQRER